MTKEVRIYIGEKTASSINGAGKNSYMQKNPPELLLTPSTKINYIKVNSKRIEDLSIRPETIKL